MPVAPAAGGQQPGPVWSCDEWSPLREVIVSTPHHLDYSQDLSFRLFFHRNLTPSAGEGPPGGPPPAAYSATSPPATICGTSPLRTSTASSACCGGTGQ